MVSFFTDRLGCGERERDVQPLVRVRDSSVGIAATHLDRIFAEFTQLQHNERGPRERWGWASPSAAVSWMPLIASRIPPVSEQPRNKDIDSARDSISERFDFACR